jgi:hypothetical protein
MIDGTGKIVEEIEICVNYNYNHCITKTFVISKEVWNEIKDMHPSMIEDYLLRDHEVQETYDDEDTIPEITVSEV